MQVEGQWTFNRQSPETIWNMLHRPSQLVQVMPDIHQLAELKPNGLRMMLEVPPAVFGFEEVAIESTLKNVVPAQSFEIEWHASSGKTSHIRGHGRIELSAQNGDTIVFYQFSGTSEGQIAQLGDPMIETQFRASMRRLFTRMDKQLRGVPLLVATRPTTSYTLVEAWLAVGALLMSLIFLVLMFRVWRRWWRRRRS